MVGDEVEVSQGLALLVAEVLHHVGLKVLLEDDMAVEFKLKRGKLNEKNEKMRKCESEASISAVQCYCKCEPYFGDCVDSPKNEVFISLTSIPPHFFSTCQFPYT